MQKVDTSLVQKSLNDMKNSISMLETDLKTTKRSADPNDRYLDLMDLFHKEAQSQYETLECMYTRMIDSYKSLADYFAFDPLKYPLGEFFTDLKAFSTQFEQCLDDNRRARETEEKIKRAEQERAAREREREARKNQKEMIITAGGAGASKGAGKNATSSGVSSSDIGDTGVMDNLYALLIHLRDLSESNINSVFYIQIGSIAKRTFI